MKTSVLAINDHLSHGLIFIGMPGSGKSTLGKYIAALRGLKFIDTDELIEQKHGYSLQHLLDRHGHQFIRRAESEIICALESQNHVIATGGSAVYSEDAMLHLRDLGKVIYLHISLPTVIARVGRAPDRGIAKLPNVSLASLYRERLPLYQRWANVTLQNNWPLTDLRLEQLANQLDIVQQ
ncbi:MAG: shikimate kinase [Arenicella sp.]